MKYKIDINIIQNTLYNKHVINLFNYIKFNNIFTEEDLVQELYLHHVEKNIIPTFITIKRFLINIINKKENKIHKDDIDSYDDVASSEDNTNKLYVESLLSILDSDELDLIKLKFYEGYNDSEIAKKYNVDRSTITKRVNKILKKLREDS